jgi:NADH dehydrogenase
LFQPLLYQVATAGLSPADIASPVRHILSGLPGVSVFQDEIIDLTFPEDLQPGLAIGRRRQYEFDTLILACGSETSYFGHDEWEINAPGLKTLEQATEIRRRIFSAFERAEATGDQQQRQGLLTFVVVGGGPTGVELSGAIAEIARMTLATDFRHIDPSSTRVLLIEGGPRLLPSFHPALGARAKRDLEGLGVAVWTSTTVTDVRKGGVQVGDTFVSSDCVIWAAGVSPSRINRMLQDKGYATLDRRGALPVGADLSLVGHPKVYAIGDQVRFEGKAGVLPGVAPVATQQGRHCALNIMRIHAGKEALPFRYFDKGQMATIGRKKAVLEFGQIKMAGFFAWAGWLVVHIYYLIGFKNKILVLFQWAYSYFTYGRGARLLMEQDWLASEAKSGSDKVPS